MKIAIWLVISWLDWLMMNVGQKERSKVEWNGIQRTMISSLEFLSVWKTHLNIYDSNWYIHILHNWVIYISLIPMSLWQFENVWFVPGELPNDWPKLKCCYIRQHHNPLKSSLLRWGALEHYEMTVHRLNSHLH